MLRRGFIWFHRYLGLTITVFLVLIAFAGTVLVFQEKLERLVEPSLGYVQPGTAKLPLQALIDSIKAQDYVVLNLGESSEPTYSHRIVVRRGKDPLFGFVNPYTGKVLDAKSSAERDQTLMRRIYLLHTALLAGKNGKKVVEIVSWFTALMMLTGLVVWWPRKIMTVSRRGSWRRVNFDLHSAFGFFGSAIGLMLALTGVWIANEKTFNAALKQLDAVAAPVAPKVDRIKGQAALSLDTLSIIADGALAGAETKFIGPFNSPTISFTKRFPEDHTPGGRSSVMLNAYTGEVLLVSSTRTQGTGTKLINSLRDLHTGAKFGLPSQLLFGLSSFALVVQALSGVLMWWRPARAKKSAPLLAVADRAA